MIAAFPPAIHHCVDPASPAAQNSRAIWDVVGSPPVIDDLLRSTALGEWAVVVLNEVHDGKRRLSFTIDPSARYSVIAGLIHRAQTLKLDLTSRFDPPICEAEQK
ncbi:hypothetical protein [Sphingomonas sp. Leaf343]|uniref:hypothetical protein n=1 Tax=Sphingomonas sp. Leaf343 TaxID=1736345 RepID=UPI000AA15B62|nr:hypothetical protein [Sphingomonas sp. Leaf343]